MQSPEHPEDLNHIAHRFQWARIRLNLRVAEVARETGCENIDEGCRSLRAIEDAEPQPAGIYERFARVLDIDLGELTEALHEKRRHRLEKLRQDLPPRRLGKLLETVLDREEMTVEQAAASTTGEVDPNRLHRLVKGRDRLPTDGEIEALAEALDIDPQALRNARMWERDVYDRRGDVPRLIVRAVPGFYVAQPLFEPGSTKEYLDYAARFARDRQTKVCLVFGDGRSVYIDPDGSRHESFESPSMNLR